MVHQAWLKDILVFLLAAGIIAPLFHRARIGAVLGFLVAGFVVGPLGLGRLAADYPWVRILTIDDPARVEPFAELGVIFLLFLVGLEFSFARLWSLRRYVFGFGAAQVALSATAIGSVVFSIGFPTPAAITLGLCLALSSTAIVVDLLKNQSRMLTSVGRVSISVLLFQDLMVVPILFITGVLARAEGGAAILLGLASAFAQAAVAIVVIVFAGRYLLQPLMRIAGRTGSRDHIMAITILIIIVIAGGTEAAGLSAALGAFLGGLLLGETEYKHQIEIDLDPFKGVLLGLFFTTVGMSADPAILLDRFGWILLAVSALIVGKAAILFLTARAFGIGAPVASEVALLLAQSGEFAFVVFGLAFSSKLLSAEMVQFATIVVGLSMALTPLLARFAAAAGRRLERSSHAGHEPDADVADFDDHVVICGFGRVGRTIARMLDQENVPFVALDANGALVAEQRKAGRSVYFGDASRPEMLERAGMDRARAIVVTLDDPDVAERLVKEAAQRWPQVRIFARAKDSTHAGRLAALGAVEVMPEAIEASLQLGARLLEALGASEEAVLQRLADARAYELAKFVAPKQASP